MGPDRFGKCYRDSSNWIILALDNREPGVVVRRQMLPLYIPTVSMFHNEKTRFIVQLSILKGE